MSTFVRVGRLSFLRVYRRKFSTTLHRCGQLHSGFLALPAASSEALDHGRLSKALRLIKGKGRLYVGLVGSYDFPGSKFNEPSLDPLKAVLLRFHEVYQRGAALRPDVDVRVLLPNERAIQSPCGPVCVAPELEAYLGHPSEEAPLLQLNEARQVAGLAPVSFEVCDMPSIDAITVQHPQESATFAMRRKYKMKRWCNCRSTRPWSWVALTIGSMPATSFSYRR